VGKNFYHRDHKDHGENLLKISVYSAVSHPYSLSRRAERSIRCPGVRGISEAILWTNGVLSVVKAFSARPSYGGTQSLAASLAPSPSHRPAIRDLALAYGMFCLSIKSLLQAQ